MDHKNYRWPSHVGILALELVLPSRCVSQDDLELYDNVSRGKYTIGLGQEIMSFCTDREDVVSLCLTAVSNLMNRTKTSMTFMCVYVYIYKYLLHIINYCQCYVVFNNNNNNNSLGYSDIGRLEVGTETPVDKSKSIKSMLMRLFDNCDNKNVEGVDSINACYGGTAALFNSIAWIESSAWNGK